MATFCHNIAHGLDITISDVNKEIELVYIDDVIAEFLGLLLDENADRDKYHYKVARTFRITVGELAEKIYQLKDMRKILVVPDLSDDLMKCLHATYLSYIDKDNFSYKLDVKTDQRGSLAELIKSEHFGQIFVSTTHKGVIRGNHYHNSKVEKFVVLDGEAVIRFRSIEPEITGQRSEAGGQTSEVGEVIEYPVSGKDFKVVDIPPGYTHSIENVGKTDLIVLFWANEIFDGDNPDTYFEKV